jgi:hypothetical protein
VVDVVAPSSSSYSPTGSYDLGDCLTDAVYEFFNQTWLTTYYSTYGTPNHLLSFRDYGQHNEWIGSVNATTTGTSLGVPQVTGQSSGDLILIIVCTDGSSTLTAPSGFSTLYDYSGAGGSYTSVAVYYKVTSTSTETNYVGISPSALTYATKIAIRSPATNDPPFEQYYIRAANSSAYTPPMSGLGLDGLNSILIASISAEGNYVYTQTSAWTSVLKINTTNLSINNAWITDDAGTLPYLQYTYTGTSYLHFYLFEVYTR